MNYDSEYEEISSIDYVNNNMEYFLENKTINEILENNHKRSFTIDCRGQIEYMKQKYINLYFGGGIFKNDEYNANWERLFDIIYNNINKKYDLGIIQSDPSFFINILENKRLKLE
jgi:hypothetical protein|tara:strand:- start:1122 stop:1466 length:345 start_codon:yes stop_codon:yes gene_type:complete